MYNTSIKCRSSKELLVMVESLVNQFSTLFKNNYTCLTISTTTSTNTITIVSDCRPIIDIVEVEGSAATTEKNIVNNYEVSIICETNENAMSIANNIHNQLIGITQYIDSEILLNVDNNIVTVVCGAECDYRPVISFKELEELK